VIVTDPSLRCTVIKPLLLTVSTPVLSDRQFVQVSVTSCVYLFANTPRAVICAVAPVRVREEKSAEKTTAWIVDVTAVGARGTVGNDDPHAAGDWKGAYEEDSDQSFHKCTTVTRSFWITPAGKRQVGTSGLERRALFSTVMHQPDTTQLLTLETRAFSCNRQDPSCHRIG
jgi:hypothetical protein